MIDISIFSRLFPDWRQAPVWAKYVARDADGKWHWFEHRPHADKHSGQWYPPYEYSGTSRKRLVILAGEKSWSESMESRP